MSKLLLLDAVEYIADRGVSGADLLRIPTAHSYGVNNARHNHREIAEIVTLWSSEGLGKLSETEQVGLFFNFNEKAKRIAAQTKKDLNRKSWSDRLADDKFQKIGNLSISALSLLISLGALLVAIIALSKGS